MRAHIERVAGRYVGKVQGWDVVNEIIDEDGSYRSTNGPSRHWTRCWPCLRPQAGDSTVANLRSNLARA